MFPFPSLWLMFTFPATLIVQTATTKTTVVSFKHRVAFYWTMITKGKVRKGQEGSWTTRTGGVLTSGRGNYPSRARLPEETCHLLVSTGRITAPQLKDAEQFFLKIVRNPPFVAKAICGFLGLQLWKTGELLVQLWWRIEADFQGVLWLCMAPSCLIVEHPLTSIAIVQVDDARCFACFPSTLLLCPVQFHPSLHHSISVYLSGGSGLSST